MRARAPRVRTITYSRADLLAVSLVAAVVAAWAGLAGGSFSVMALLACELLFFAYYLAGSVLASSEALARGIRVELPLRLLLGYAIVNTTLLALAWLSPLGIIENFSLVLAAVAIAFFSSRRREARPGSAASLWAVGLSLVATTAWCQDSLRPIAEQDGIVVFKPWIDGFYHAVHIRIFAEGHGAATIEDFRMAGVPARLYHYGMYLSPAFVRQASGIHSYAAFAGILAPLGVFFTGLSAYACFGSLWGAWPGLAACAALLLLPDGAQQGMGNPFLSYHFLTQISPSATHGLALLGLAWLFVLRGCAQGNQRQLLLGWALAGVLAAYKLHFVVASALLLLLVPALFFRAALGLRWRAVAVVLALGGYSVALFFGQRVPGVPSIRFDGSDIGEILHLVGTFHLPGAFRDLLFAHVGRAFPATTNLLLGVPYVLCGVLGAHLPALVALVIALRRRVAPLERVFPLLLLVNFLAMFFGLALDMRSSTPDELSHRPLLIPYFFAVAWVGGAAGLLLQRSPRLGRAARPVLLGLATVLLVVPASFGRQVQLMWAMPRISPVRVPSALVRVAEHLRTHGDRRDVFQDSQFDRFYAIAALSERRTFVAHTLTNMPYRGDQVAARTAAVDQMMLQRLPKLVVGTAQAFGIRWFVRRAGDRVRWPPELADAPALEVGAFRVYDLQ